MIFFGFALSIIKLYLLIALRYFSLAPENMIYKNKYSVISYYDNNIIKQLYIPYDRDFSGGYTNVGFYQPDSIPLLVGEKEFGEKVEIQEE